MNHDLDLISQWAYTWRMSFNLFNSDPQKQAVESKFSMKKSEIDHSVILFNDIPVKKEDEHKHLGIILDSKLSFSAHIKSAISKRRKAYWFAEISLQIPAQAYSKRNLEALCSTPHGLWRCYLSYSCKSM